MDLTLILKTVGFMFAFYLIAKAVAPYISDLFSSRNKNQDHDIDAMIRRKMEYLQVTGQANVTTTNSGTKNKKSTKRKDYAEEVKHLFRTLSQNNNKTEQMRLQMSDLKRTMEVLDALQWGTSNELSNVRKRYERHFDLAVPENMVLASLRLILEHGQLFNERKEPIGCDELLDACTVLCFHQLMSNSLSGDEALAKQQAKRWHSDLRTLQRAWLTWIARKEKRDLPQFMSELLEHEILDASTLQLLLGYGPQSLPWGQLMMSKTGHPKPEELLEQIKEELTVMQAITPLNISEPLDQAQALAVMGFQHIPAPGILSRRYKKLARLLHPDKLASYGFSSHIIDMATSNFKTMKSAYDLLRKDME